MFCSRIFKFSIGSVLGTVWPKNVGNRASCDGRNNAEKYAETLQDNFFQGMKAMLEMKKSHSSSSISMQPLTNQYLPKFTSVSVRSVLLHDQPRYLIVT